MELKVVTILEDGRRLKGVTERFDPEKSFLLLRRVDMEGNTLGFLDIEMGSIVAAFFVHDLALDRTSRHTPSDGAADTPDPDGGTMVRVRLSWGEVIDGLVYDFRDQAEWFFLHPVGELNRSANNKRVYLSSRAVATREVLAVPTL